MVIRDRKHSLPNPLVYTNIYEFQNNPFATQYVRVKKRDLKKILSNKKVYMKIIGRRLASQFMFRILHHNNKNK